MERIKYGERHLPRKMCSTAHSGATLQAAEVPQSPQRLPSRFHASQPQLIHYRLPQTHAKIRYEGKESGISRLATRCGKNGKREFCGEEQSLLFTVICLRTRRMLAPGQAEGNRVATHAEGDAAFKIPLPPFFNEKKKGSGFTTFKCAPIFYYA